jgi:hypothetical protein
LLSYWIFVGCGVLLEPGDEPPDVLPLGVDGVLGPDGVDGVDGVLGVDGPGVGVGVGVGPGGFTVGHLSVIGITEPSGHFFVSDGHGLVILLS